MREFKQFLENIQTEKLFAWLLLIITKILKFVFIWIDKIYIYNHLEIYIFSMWMN